MKEFLKKVKGNVLLYTIRFIIIFVVLHLLLKLVNVQFRQWVYYMAVIIGFVGLTIGSIQKVKTKSKKIKIISSILGVLVILILPLVVLFMLLTYTPEHVVVENHIKYVVYVKSFLRVKVRYYTYINCFVVGNKIKKEVDYGKGGYDPFDGEHDYSTQEYTLYYDSNGNIIRK